MRCPTSVAVPLVVALHHSMGCEMMAAGSASEQLVERRMSGSMRGRQKLRRHQLRAKMACRQPKLALKQLVLGQFRHVSST